MHSVNCARRRVPRYRTAHARIGANSEIFTLVNVILPITCLLKIPMTINIDIDVSQARWFSVQNIQLPSPGKSVRLCRLFV